MRQGCAGGEEGREEDVHGQRRNATHADARCCRRSASASASASSPTPASLSVTVAECVLGWSVRSRWRAQTASRTYRSPSARPSSRAAAHIVWTSPHRLDEPTYGDARVAPAVQSGTSKGANRGSSKTVKRWEARERSVARSGSELDKGETGEEACRSRTPVPEGLSSRHWEETEVGWRHSRPGS